MLAVHIQLFAFPSLARWNPTAYGDFSGINWWVWVVTSVLADGKFIAIFAMLLGASIVMQSADRAAPAWRARYLSNDVFGGNEGDGLLEGEPAFERPALLACPGADV